MPTNFYMYFLVALIPMIIGAIYYHPKVLGTAWMNSNGFTMKDLEGGNMLKIMGGAYLLAVLLAFGLTGAVIHQMSVFGLLIPEAMDVATPEYQDVMAFMEKYGDRHRTFTHGMVHGMEKTVFLILPIIGIVASFERRGWKYVLIHFIYWAITLMLMGGVLSSTLQFAEF